jgi:hypothetical protein
VGGSSGADFYHTSTTLIDVLTPGGGYISDSGHIYALPGLAGDYNQDGIVDAADYTVWRDTLSSTTNLTADGNGNGLIDTGDYDVWKMHFGQTAGSGSGGAAGVPEPSGLWMLIIGILTMCGRRHPLCL